MPLSLRVLHAGGRPAFGGRVALYDAARRLAGEGVLDDGGAWSHSGIDGPVEVFVLGLGPEAARFELNPGRGEHEFTLRAGAWLEGQLLLDGAPPGQPFPLGLDVIIGDYKTLGDREGRPRDAGVPGEVFSSRLYHGGFFTDFDGRFMVSGLQAGSEVSLEWPRLYELDASYPLTLPLTVPASDIVLALRRPFMIRGRVLRPSGVPATDALLSVEIAFARVREPGTPKMIRGGVRVGMSRHDSPVDGEGRFAIAIGDPFRNKGALAITMNLDLVARGPAGSWVDAALVDEVVTRAFVPNWWSCPG